MQTLDAFGNIDGYDDLKEIVKRALNAPDPVIWGYYVLVTVIEIDYARVGKTKLIPHPTLECDEPCCH